MFFFLSFFLVSLSLISILGMTCMHLNGIFTFNTLPCVCSQKERSKLVGTFFSGRRWSDDTVSRAAVIRTNGEQEKQKEWDRERGQGHREGARGQLEGQAVRFVCLQQQYRAAESYPMTVSLRAVCTLSTHTHKYTHTRVTAELLSCRCSQLETATLLKSDVFFFFFTFLSNTLKCMLRRPSY